MELLSAVGMLGSETLKQAPCQNLGSPRVFVGLWGCKWFRNVSHIL